MGMEGSCPTSQKLTSGHANFDFNECLLFTKYCF